MDQLNAMHIFVTVVQSGNFSAAARKQNTSQATVSKKVAGLEAKLGVKLITRTSREFSLTQAGTEYYRYCAAFLEELDEVENRIRAQVTSPKGLLRVAAPAPLGRLMLAPLLSEFMVRFPDIEVDLSIEDRHVDLIAEGIDVAIRARELEDSSLVARTLFENKIILVASQDYVNNRGKPKVPSDLINHNCIVYTLAKSLNNWHFTQNEEEVTIPVKGTIRSNSGETNLKMALEGFGVAQIPEWMVRKYIQQGTLIPLLTDYQTDGLPMNLIYPKNRHIPSKVRCFIDFMKEKIPKNF